MLFSEHVAAVKIPDFVANKVKGKAFAQACGFQTAAVFNPAGEFIIKPVHGHSARGVMRTHAGATIVEELLTDAAEFTPPMDYRFHCFQGRARLLQLTKTEQVGGALVHNFFFLPALERAVICRYPEGDLVAEAEVVAEIMALAEKAAARAGAPYIRLDFYHTTKGICWGEACVTPGFATPRNKKITPEADELLGSWLAGD